MQLLSVSTIMSSLPTWSVPVPADNHINSANRIQHLGKLFVLLKSDMGKKHGKIYIYGVICVAYFANRLVRL